MQAKMDEKMEAEKSEAEKSAAGKAPGAISRAIPKLALDWTLRVWRPAGTAIAVGLALLLTWHVINGKHGLSVWHQQHSEDRGLQQEIKDLEEENAQLRDRIEKLKSDPDAIAREAREKLHYAKPNEVIVALPATPESK